MRILAGPPSWAYGRKKIGTRRRDDLGRSKTIFCLACRNRARQAPEKLELESSTAESKVTSGGTGGAAGSRAEKWNSSDSQSTRSGVGHRRREKSVLRYMEYRVWSRSLIAQEDGKPEVDAKQGIKLRESALLLCMA
jgi:hypothetical protein